jgi:transposase
MITVGVDAHKRVHVALALDDAGRELAHWRGPNSVAGWEQLLRWAQAWQSDLQWGIEGAWGYGRGLAQFLVASGQRVYEVNARWTALGRKRARKSDKTDLLDARAIAQMVRQEEEGLPAIQQEDRTTLLDMMTTERERALAEATRLRNQIHALLLHLDPQYPRVLKDLKSKKSLNVLENYPVPDRNPVQQERALSVRRLAQRLRLALDQVAELAQRIKKLAAQHALPLTRLCGVNLLTAGALAGILGPGQRFGNDAQLAAYAGVAPIEASSAGITRHRLSRAGNRRLNSIIYRIALTQAKHHPEARAYLERRVSEGKTRREAFRALKRYIVRAVWKLWQECGLAQLGGNSHTIGSTETLAGSICPQEGMAMRMVS